MACPFERSTVTTKRLFYPDHGALPLNYRADEPLFRGRQEAAQGASEQGFTEPWPTDEREMVAPCRSHFECAFGMDVSGNGGEIGNRKRKRHAGYLPFTRWGWYPKNELAPPGRTEQGKHIPGEHPSDMGRLLEEDIPPLPPAFLNRASAGLLRAGSGNLAESWQMQGMSGVVAFVHRHH